MIGYSESSVTVADVGYQYSGLAGAFRLGPISLEIPFGKLTFWVGANGSGKSTLARILAGELGDGVTRPRNAQRMVTYHHQALGENVFPTLTVSDHLRLAGIEADARSEVSEMFPELVAVRSRYPDELSGGQLQLLGFVFLAQRGRRLYIFDEVLNHLDRSVAAGIFRWIRQNVLSDKSAVVVISHDLAAATMHADTVVVFEDGRLKCELDRGDLTGDPSQLAGLMDPRGAIPHGKS